MSEEAYVLASFHPSELRSEIIEVEIKNFLADCCRSERVSVRVPEGIEPHPDNLEWHQDGGGPKGITRHMVVWASEMPTEIRSSEGIESEFQPFDLIWFDNFKAWHRQPRGTRAKHRWFASVRCSGEVF